MVYLFSSSPKTIEKFFVDKKITYTLVTKVEYDSFIATYEKMDGDFGIVYDFGKIIPQRVLDQILLLNIHFSLLPKYRGATPVEAAILHGEQKTGITVQRMAKEMDAGDVLLTREVDINPDWNSGELQKHMDSALPELLEEVFLIPMDKWDFSVQVGEPTFCYMSLLDRANAEIKRKNMTIEHCLNMIRAFNPEPYAWIRAKKKSGQEVTINILRAERYDADFVGDFGFVKQKGLLLRVRDGVVLVTELVVAGQKPLSGGNIVALKGQFEEIY